MKTVMKKMFSLLLVAVLLVGALPFSAFAAEKTLSYALTLEAGETYSVDAIKAEKYSGSSTNYWVHLRNTEDYVDGETFEAIEGGDYTLYVVETIEESQPVIKTCSTCGESYNEGAAHTCPTVTCETCKETYTKGTSHRCPTVTCETCKETYTKGTSHHCPTVTCENCNETYTKGTSHSCPDYETSQTGKYTLRVFANLYTGDVKTKTIELKPYTNLSENTLLYDFISKHESQIRAQIPSGYYWSGNVYNHKNSDTAIGTNTRLGAGTSVYLNFRSSADYVYIYVHTSRTYEIDRTYKMDGKKVGETIYKSEVKDIIKKNYNVSSLSMFSNASDWEKYVQKKSIDAVDTVTAKDGITEIHVRVNGSSKSSSTSKADSSNPKTGDMIMTPVIVLGASATCLAVLFYLNKKRAH